MPASRKTISSLLLLVMLLPLFFCIITKIKQQHLRREARENLERKSLRKIILTADQFEWTEEGKEITINDDLFDVKSYSVDNQKFVFTGLLDKEETALTKLQQDWKKNRQENKLLTELFQVLQSMFHYSKGEQSLYVVLDTHYPCLILNKFPLPHKKIITPPPRA